MLIQQLSIFVENKTGRLAEIAEIIAAAGVDLRALSIADTSDFGILRLIVNQPQAAMQALQNANIMVTLTDVIAVGIEDIPGAFAKVCRLISDHDIGIEYMYAFITHDTRQAYMILRTEEPAHAVSVLQANQIPLLSSEAVYNM